MIDVLGEKLIEYKTIFISFEKKTKDSQYQHYLASQT